MIHLLILALAPAVAIMVFVYLMDKYDREPLHLLVKCFLFGVVSIVPAIAGTLYLENYFQVQAGPDFRETFVYAFLVVGFSEELAKFLFLRFYIYKRPEFDEPFDGIVYSVMIGMGFAAFENVFYVLEGGVGVGIARMFTAVPAHATFGVIMGYFAGKAKFNRGRENALLFTGFAGAVFFHGAYDFFLMLENIPGIFIGAIVSLIIAIRLSLLAMRAAQQKSPFHPNNIFRKNTDR